MALSVMRGVARGLCQVPRARAATRRPRAAGRPFSAAGHSKVQAGFGHLFDLMDTDGDGEIGTSDLRDALAILHRGDPKTYEVLAPLLMDAVKDGGRLSKKLLVQRLALIRPERVTNATMLLCFALESSGEALTEEWKRIRGRSAVFMTGHDCIIPFEEPHTELFPKQKVRGTRPEELRRAKVNAWEYCPEGYMFASYLGGGAFAKVFLVRNAMTGNLQAMKRVDRNLMKEHHNLAEDKVSLLIEQEFMQMRHCDHPHIVRLMDFHQDSRFSYFIMEAANGGDLKRAIDRFYGHVQPGTVTSLHQPLLVKDRGPELGPSQRRLAEAYVAEVLDQICYGLNYLHQDLRIHKDVKTENIMLLKLGVQRPHAVLIDLGLAEILVDDEAALQKRPKAAGTPHTMAPEVIETYLGERPEGFSTLADIFSLGVCAFELLTGEAPYEANVLEPPTHELLEAIRRLDVEAQLIQAGRSGGVASLVAGMMAVDPAKRLSAREVMLHPWMAIQRERQTAKQLRNDGREAALQLGEKRGAAYEKELGEKMSLERRRFKARMLVEFSQQPKQFRNAAFHLVSVHLPMAQLQRTARWFRRIDKDLSGGLDFAEVAEEIHKHTDLSAREALEAARALDTNGSGDVSFTDFAAASVCFDDTKRLAPWLSEALEANWDACLDYHEVPRILAKAAGGRLQMGNLEEWLQAAFKLQNETQGAITAAVVKPSRSL